MHHDPDGMVRASTLFRSLDIPDDAYPFRITIYDRDDVEVWQETVSGPGDELVPPSLLGERGTITLAVRFADGTIRAAR